MHVDTALRSVPRRQLDDKLRRRRRTELLRVSIWQHPAFYVHDFFRAVQPQYIQGKTRVFHPKTMFAGLVIYKQHTFVCGQMAAATQTFGALGVIISNRQCIFAAVYL